MMIKAGSLVVAPGGRDWHNKSIKEKVFRASCHLTEKPSARGDSSGFLSRRSIVSGAKLQAEVSLGDQAECKQIAPRKAINSRTMIE